MFIQHFANNLRYSYCVTLRLKADTLNWSWTFLVFVCLLPALGRHRLWMFLGDGCCIIQEQVRMEVLWRDACIPFSMISRENNRPDRQCCLSSQKNGASTKHQHKRKTRKWLETSWRWVWCKCLCLSVNTYRLHTAHTVISHHPKNVLNKTKNYFISAETSYCNMSCSWFLYFLSSTGFRFTWLDHKIYSCTLTHVCKYNKFWSGLYLEAFDLGLGNNKLDIINS